LKLICLRQIESKRGCFSLVEVIGLEDRQDIFLRGWLLNVIVEHLLAVAVLEHVHFFTETVCMLGRVKDKVGSNRVLCVL